MACIIYGRNEKVNEIENRLIFKGLFTLESFLVLYMENNEMIRFLVGIQAFIFVAKQFAL